MDDRGTNLVAALAVALYDEVLAGTAESGVENPTAAAALAVLHAEPGCGVEALVPVLGVTGSGAARLVATLVGRGWVDKRPDPRDGRAVSLHLTQAGQELATRVLAARKARMDAVFSTLDPSQQRTLAELAEQLLAAMPRDRDHAERICRLCDCAVCPQDQCPVELAVS